jgi:hypothetical protein
MPVFTQDEYDVKQQYENKDSSSHIEVVKEKKEKILETTYVLLHPENDMGNYQNFEDEIVLNGRIYKRKCVNGIIRTKEITLVNYLKEQDYLLLDIINKE